jgi:hypothetical protein
MTRLLLGWVVVTPGALKLLEEVGEDPLRYLTRHASRDWGEVDPQDRWENERSLKHGWRVLSSYPVGEDRLDHHRGRQVRHHHSPSGGVLDEGTRLHPLLPRLLV